ncbi:MAG: hypothetical protein MUO53_09350, partial [Maribacter sp.]|nr:hypothetical protein [Maribacter sp.]
YRYRDTFYHIIVTQRNSMEEMIVTLDGEVQAARMITLTDDGVEHNVQVEISTNLLQKNLKSN